MNKTKIDWCDSSWNPVTGCAHDCPYCYARGIAQRFAGYWSEDLQRHLGADGGMHDLDKPLYRHTTGKNRDKPVHSVQAAYPFGFDPTFHRYRLDDYKSKEGRTIFVGSMCDLFGDWVPDEWIRAVFEACAAAPQHRYLFLTKNPARFQSMFLMPTLSITKNLWFGFSATNQEQLNSLALGARWLPVNSFISIEPVHGPIDLTRIAPTGRDAYLDFLTGRQYFLTEGDENGKRLKWVIVGAESGNRKGKIIPERKWIENIIHQCHAAKTPVFMKESLRDLMGDDFVQEFPWERSTP